MSRNMQSKAQTHPLLSTELTNLMTTGAALALIVATAIVLLFVAPANAAHAPGTAPEQLTVWAEELPDNFQALATDAGLDVMDIERLVSLDTHIVVVQSIDNHSPERLLEMLGATFPALVFESMNGSEENFELVEN